MEPLSTLHCYNCFREKPDGGPCPHCGFDLEENVKKFPVALRAGTVLNSRYIVGRVLGQGGFGITYLAWDTKLEARVAVKEFMPNEIATRVGTTVSVAVESRTEDFTYGAERFQEEARTLAKFMGQPNIAGVTDYFDENDTSYFVMDYIEGISFKTYIANQGGKVSVDEALNVMIPVLRALTAVHAEGFIHRDVTPDNIYITKDGMVKLLDFGSARYSIGDKSKSLDVVLKVGYAPKEQYIRRGRQGPYTDVYSCAACFYAALTGYLPPEALERLDQDELVPVSQAGVELPEWLDKAILKGLAVQPEDRFQSAAEFLDAIENQQVVEVPVPGGTPAPAPVKKKPLPLILGGAAAVLAVAVGIGAFMGGGNRGGGKDGGVIEAMAPKVTIAGQEVSLSERFLELENTTLTAEDLSVIDQLSNLKRIHFDKVDLSEVGLSWVSDYPDLEEFSIETSGAIDIDLSLFSHMTEMRRLSFYHNGNNQGGAPLDLSPIAGLTKLERLDLYGYITDLSPLSGMTGLTELQIWGNVQTKDFTALSGLTKLTRLYLNVSGVERLDGLEGMTQMTELRLNNASSNGNGNFYVTDLTPLSGMTQLQSLEFNSNGLASFHGMENLTQLREVRFYGSDATYTDVDPLAGLSNLRSLRLPIRTYGDGTKPYDIQGLAKMTALVELDIPTGVADLSPLAGLTGLTYLSFRNGGYVSGVDRDLSPLAGLTDLTELFICVDERSQSSSQVDLSPLAGLTKLNTLYISATSNSGWESDTPSVRNLSVLSGMTELRELTLNVTNVSDISPLRELTKLQSVTVYSSGRNQVTDWSPVDHVPNLTKN